MLKRISHDQARFLLNNLRPGIMGVHKPTDMVHGTTYLMPTGCKFFCTLCGPRKSYHLSGYGNGRDVERLVEAIDQRDLVTSYVIQTINSNDHFESAEAGKDLDGLTKKCYELIQSHKYRKVDLYERRLIGGVKLIAQWTYE